MILPFRKRRDSPEYPVWGPADTEPDIIDDFVDRVIGDLLRLDLPDSVMFNLIRKRAELISDLLHND